MCSLKLAFLFLHRISSIEFPRPPKLTFLAQKVPRN